MEVKRARAEISKREWLEFEVQFGTDGSISDVHFKAWGCHKLLSAADQAATGLKKSKQLSDFRWKGVEHWDLLISEVIDKLQDRFALPVTEAETCHCRKIPTLKIDEAIVLGAHSPEVVKAWTTAGSGCGTCRPEVQKLIDYRTKKS